MQNCGSGDCTISPPQSVSNTSALGCLPPTSAANCNCGIINLVGTASGTPTSDFWNIIGPNAANIWGNYTGSSIGTTATPLEPGDYQIFHIAGYTCTNGSPGNITENIKVTVPYIANFSYSVECNGSNYNIALIDTSPYYAPVTSRTYTYYSGSTATGPWTQVSGTANPDYTITNQAAGSRYIRLVITGTLASVAQTPCEKIRLVSIATSPLPSITASIIPVSCHDSSIKFDVSGTPVLGYTYLWTFDGGATNTLRNPERVFTNSGPQTVYLEIKNKYGCVITPPSQLQYALSVPAKCFNGAVSSTPNPASVCAGNSVTLQYTPAADNCAVSSYTWMNGNVPMGVSSPSTTVNSEGFYWVKVTSSNLCTYETPNRITPLFKPLPTLETAPIATFCRGADMPVSIATNATTISWVIDGAPYNVFDNQKSITIPGVWGLGAGTHPIIVTVTSAQGCTTTATLTLTIVNAPPVPVITPTLVSCDPYLVQLDATGSYGYYNWSNGVGGTTTITVNDGGPYEVTVAANGCTSRSQIYVPKSPENFLWVFPSGCFTGCKESLGTLIGPSILPVSAWEWDYEHNPSATGIGAVASFDLTQSGVYNLTLNTGFCAQTSHDLNYTQVECIKCAIEVQIEKLESHESPFCNVTMDLVIINNSGNPLPITVTSPNNEVIVTANSFIAVPGNNIFHVTVTPINGFNGGTLTLFLQGYDTKGNKLCNTPLLFTMPSCHPSGKMQNPSIKNSNSLVIAPNPSKGLTSISFSNGKVPTLEVYTLLGKKVANYTASTTKGSWELDTTTLPTGVYIVVMKENDAVVLQQKLIVE